MKEYDFVIVVAPALCRGIGILPMNEDQLAVSTPNRHRLEADATGQQ
jgi:hypothetical protein